MWSLSKKNAISDGEISPTVMEAHQGRIWTIAVCPDDGGFYTGGEDATICFFKVSAVESTMDENGGRHGDTN